MPSGHHFVAPSISPLPSGQHFMDSTLTLDFHKFPRFSSFCIFWILARSALSVISSFCSPSERINKGIFGHFEVFGRISSFSSWMQGLETKISSPLGRARRVLLVTSMEHLEHVPRRIRGEITRIRCQLHLRHYSLEPRLSSIHAPKIKREKRRFLRLIFSLRGCKRQKTPVFSVKTCFYSGI
jgi:hypothetical protein